ncbi:MAG: cyclodeaminase/cyclohydrolase family protein [Clostridiales bacterium]|nr:cyclodeaminase/cyclohydrolase family protein [Clostridiales bacterium]
MLNEMTITDFTALLASDAPAPGGGTASALMGAVGVSLTSMVAALTVGKPKYAAHQARMEGVLAEGGRLRVELLALMDADAEAFNQVTAAFGLPKGSDDEKATRRETIQTALQVSTETPCAIMRAAVEALRLTETAMEGYNTNAASDLGVAALGLSAALRGAWLNVCINLGSIKDMDFVARYRDEGEALLAEGTELADKIYQGILVTL